jgi:hypothetical protein
LIAVVERGRRADADAVDLGAEKARQVLENVLSIFTQQPRVPARNVLLRQTDDVALVPSDRHLVTVERENDRSSFIVFDNKLVHHTGFPAHIAPYMTPWLRVKRCCAARTQNAYEIQRKSW